KSALVSPCCPILPAKKRSRIIAGRDPELEPLTWLRYQSHLSTLRKSSGRLSFAITRHHRKNETTCLHRLDARPCVRTDVSDALLRLLDEPGGQEIVVIDWVVQTGWNVAGAALHFLGGRVFRVGDGKVARKGNRAQHHREANDFARGGSLWHGPVVSHAGICAGLPVVAVDGFAARRRSKHPGPFDDAHGSVVLERRGWRCRRGKDAHAGRSDGCGGNRGHGHATALDDASAEVPAVAHRVLHQRRAHFRSAAAVALSAVSLVGVRFRRTRGGFFPFFGLCQTPGGPCFRDARRRGNPGNLAFGAV